MCDIDSSSHIRLSTPPDSYKLSPGSLSHFKTSTATFAGLSNSLEKPLISICQTRYFSVQANNPLNGVAGNYVNSHSKPYALDQLFTPVILRFGTRSRSLDIDSTDISGSC